MIQKKIRCMVCRKKITFSYIECKCGGFYCGNHRYPHEHDCEIDYKKIQQEKIRNNNPIVVKPKIEKI
mgnify:CR=1 FL=1